MPTLPTPTTCRTTSTAVKRSNNRRRSSWSVRRYSREQPLHDVALLVVVEGDAQRGLRV